MKWQTFKTTIKRIYQTASMEALQQGILFYFMPGTYRRTWQEGTINIEETIYIKALCDNPSLYRITRTVVTSYHSEEKLVSQKAEDSFYAAYHKALKILVPQVWEAYIFFYPAQNLLIIDNAEYQKIAVDINDFQSLIVQ